MAKSSPRRVTSYINGKEMEVFVTFVFFRILRPAKQPPMFTTRTYSPLPTMISVGDIFCTDSCGPRDLSPSPHTCGVCLLFAFSAKERDVETGLSYFGARYYSPDLSIWLSVDPMFAKYPSLSPYVYCADNPVKLVDPNGEEIWFPDVDGNLIAQDGDNYKSLAVTINCSYNKAKKILANQGYKDGVNEGDKVNLDNPYTRSINATCEQRLTDDQAVAYALQWNKLGLSDEEMELRYKELACPQDLYNCWSAAITGANGGMIGPGNYDIFTEEEFDRSLDNKYPVGTDKFKFGKTIFKFEQNGKCTHAAVYYGSDKENNIYIYSKNGRFSKPFVMPLNEFLERYGFQYGEVSGYYN